MDRESTGSEPPLLPTEQHAAVKLPDDTLRKQQLLRRHLQDPASPAFNDPVHAAELAGFPAIRQSRDHPDPDRSPASSYNHLGGIRQAILDAVARKASTIEKLRRRVSEGMDATKIVIVSDGEGGVRRSVRIPDQAARREWAQLCAWLENLVPGKGGNPSSDTLPHDAAQAEELERIRGNDVEYEVSRMNAADRFLVSQYLLKIDRCKDIIRRQVLAAKLGKSPEEFEGEVEQEVRSEMRQFRSRVCQNRPRAGTSDELQRRGSDD